MLHIINPAGQFTIVMTLTCNVILKINKTTKLDKSTFRLKKKRKRHLL